jgi:hypothetical protein
MELPPIEIPPGKSRDLQITTRGMSREVAKKAIENGFSLTGTCGLCGAALKQVGPWTWGCPNEPWYRRLFRRYLHVRLTASYKEK